MNLMKSIKINGEVFSEYAFLSYCMEFEESESSVRCECVFKLPEKSYLSDMKIDDKSGRIITTKAIGLSHAARLFDTGETLATLRYNGNGEYMLALNKSKNKSYRIFLTLYAPIESSKCLRLILPTAKKPFGDGGEPCEMGVNLLVHGKSANISSPTHAIKKIYKENGVEVISENAYADRDFCVEIENSEHKNSAIYTDDGIRKEMICCVGIPDGIIKNENKNLWLIYDQTGSLKGGAAAAAKEFCLYAAKNFGVTVLIAKDELYEIDNNLEETLSQSEIGGGSLSAMLNSLSDRACDDVLPVLICGEPTEGGLVVSAAEKLKESGLCAVSFGAYEQSDDISRLTELCGGLKEHIYGFDNIEKRTGEIFERFLKNYGNMTVSADFAQAYLLSKTDDRIYVYLKCTGGAIPDILKINNIAVSIGNIKFYRSFRPICIARAAAELGFLENELRLCDADDAIKIKECIEKVGVMYNVLNSETALSADISGEHSEMIRVISENTGIVSHKVFDNRPSMFMEDTGIKDIEYIMSCVDIVKKSIHSDGAITAAGEIDDSLRKVQTLVSLLSLAAAKMLCKERFKKSIDFIKGFEYKGAVFEYEPEAAEHNLAKLFNKNRIEKTDGIPDLITAVKIIYENCDKFKRNFY